MRVHVLIRGGRVHSRAAKEAIGFLARKSAHLGRSHLIEHRHHVDRCGRRAGDGLMQLMDAARQHRFTARALSVVRRTDCPRGARLCSPISCIPSNNLHVNRRLDRVKQCQIWLPRCVARRDFATDHEPPLFPSAKLRAAPRQLRRGPSFNIGGSNLRHQRFTS